MKSLYILDIRPLSEMLFANMFSHSNGCPSASLTASFVVQKLLSLTQSCRPVSCARPPRVSIRHPVTSRSSRDVAEAPRILHKPGPASWTGDGHFHSARMQESPTIPPFPSPHRSPLPLWTPSPASIGSRQLSATSPAPLTSTPAGLSSLSS